MQKINLAFLFAFSVLVESRGSAQSLVGPTAPIAAGQTATFFMNSGPGYTTFQTGPSLFQLSATGDLVAPEYATYTDFPTFVAPGATTAISHLVPATGPGSFGSHVVFFPELGGAVARLDVVAATPGFPSIHSFPRRIHLGPGSHFATFSGAIGAPRDWAFGNVSNTNFTFPAFSVLEVLSADNTAVLATLPLSGILVPAFSVTTVPLPILNPEPSSALIRTSWNDPVAGPITRICGVHPARSADLHLPAGREIAPNSSLPVKLHLESVSGLAPLYALAVGIQPGNTVLPGNVIAPLAFDALVQASFDNGLSGLLSNHIGAAQNSIITCFCPPGLDWMARNIGISHPNLPFLSGVQVRVAAVSLDLPFARWIASQGEILTIL